MVISLTRLKVAHVPECELWFPGLENLRVAVFSRVFWAADAFSRAVSAVARRVAPITPTSYESCRVKGCVLDHIFRLRRRSNDQRKWMHLTLTGPRRVERDACGSVETGFALLAVDSVRVVLTVDAHASSIVFSVFVQTLASHCHIFIKEAFVAVAMTVTGCNSKRGSHLDRHLQHVNSPQIARGYGVLFSTSYVRTRLSSLGWQVSRPSARSPRSTSGSCCRRCCVRSGTQGASGPSGAARRTPLRVRYTCTGLRSRCP